MSTIVEHNDVDISPLFKWSKEFEIVSSRGTAPVYMRILGDADINRARVAALRNSAELRRKLRIEDSDERLAFIKDSSELETDMIISIITVFSMRELTEKAMKNVKVKPPKAPRSDSKTSVHEKYQAEIDAYPEKRQKEIKSYLEKEITDLKTKLSAESKDNLYKRYLNTMIDELCEQELLKTFKEWCCYLGSYSDEDLTLRLFESFDDFANLEPDLKQQFLKEYSSIELHGDDLKKLQQVTQ